MNPFKTVMATRFKTLIELSNSLVIFVDFFNQSFTFAFLTDSHNVDVIKIIQKVSFFQDDKYYL